jgi:hypothetical protein
VTWLDLWLGLLVFAASAGIDFANTRYVQAVGRTATHAAARWSVLQWSMSLVGFVVAIKHTLWMLPIECLGLYVGCWLSLRRQKKQDIVSK